MAYPDDPDPSAKPPQPQTRYNTTANWQDPYNPPSPGDPYWDEWIAANPDYRGQGYNGPPVQKIPVPQNPPPTGGGGGTPPPTPTLTSNNPGIPITPNTNPIPPWIPPTPTFNAPSTPRPPPFSYPGFEGPTAESVVNTPGYQFRFGQGLGAIENSKAAQGVIGTGGSIKDFMNYGQNFASNEFNNEWNRQFSEYGANRANALTTYNTNYQTQYVDPFQQAFQNARETLQPQMLGYQTQVNAGLQNDAQNRLYQFNNQVFDYNRTRNTQLDTFDEWYRRFMLQLQAAGM